MTLLLSAGFVLVALTGTAVVLTRDPARQAVTLSAYGLTLAVLFVILMAPDVALSQIAVGTAVVPLMVMLSVRKEAAGLGDTAPQPDHAEQDDDDA